MMNSVNIFLCLFILLGKGNCNSLPKLPSIDRNHITVSGFSSGGAFATQFHVAHSSLIKGVGIWAGMAYLCSFLSPGLTCNATPWLISADLLVKETRVVEGLKLIDPTSNLKKSKIHIVHGKYDLVVNHGAGNVINSYYGHFVDAISQIKALLDLPANHDVISDRRGTPCGIINGDTHIEDCDIDTVFSMFKHINPNIVSPPYYDKSLTGKLETFSQGEFFPSFASMSQTGYYYVPEACKNDANLCQLHVHFHGCLMSADLIGTKFILASGFLEIADANNIVLLFPQVTSSLTTNTGYCWNYTGYLLDYFGATYATKNGVQMKGIYNMIRRMAF